MFALSGHRVGHDLAGKARGFGKFNPADVRAAEVPVRAGLFQGTFIIPDIEGVITSLLVVLRVFSVSLEEVMKGIEDVLNSPAGSTRG